MTPFARAGWGLVLLLAAGAAHAGGAREEQERLQGEWVTVELGYVGSVKPPPKPRPTVTAGDRMSSTTPRVEYVIRLTPSREPREIELAPQTGINKGKAVY